MKSSQKPKKPRATKLRSPGDASSHKAKTFTASVTHEVVMDITEEHRQAEEALRDSKERFRNLANLLPQIVFECDEKGNFTFFNHQGFEITGYTEDDLAKGLNALELFAPQDRDRAAKNIKKRLSGNRMGHTEYTALKKDGTTFPVSIYSNPIISGNKIVGLRGIAIDLTEQKSVEEELKLRSQLLDSVSDLVLMADLDSNIIYANESAHKLTGFTREELMGMKIRQLNTLESDKLHAPLMEKLIEKGEITFETTLLRKDGSIMPLEVHSRTIKLNDRKFTLNIARDISQHKKAEEELRQSEQKYQNLIEGTRAGIASIDITGKVTFVNKAVCEVSGYSEKHLVGKPFADFVHPDDKERVTKMFLDAFINPQSRIELDFRIICRDGQTIYIRAHVSPLKANNETTGFNAVITDITERKKLEETLEKERQELALILDSSPVIIFYKDKEGRFVRVNYAFAEALQMPAEKFIGKTAFDLYSAEVAQSMTNDDQNVLKSGRPKLNIIEQNKLASGIKWLNTDKIPIFDNGITVGLIGFVQDITERKKLEEIVEKERQELKLILDSSPIIIFYKDKEGRFLRINHTFAEVLQMPAEKLVGKTVFDIFSAEIAQSMTKDDQEVLKSGRPKLKIIEQCESASGLRWLQTDKIPIFDNGSVVGLVGFAQDITERKRAEDELKLRAQLLDNATDFIFLRDLDENFVYANETALKALGYSQAEFLKLKVSQAIAPGYPYIQGSLLKQLMAKSTVTFETVSTRKDGSTIPTEVHARLIEVGGRKLVLSAVRDITKRKDIELSLRKNEQRLKEAEKLGRIGNWEFDVATQKIEWSDEVYRLYQRDKALGPPTAEEEAGYYTPEEAKRLREFARLAVEKGKVQEYDMTANLPGGRAAFFHCTMHPVKDDQGKVIKLFGTVQDITEQKINELEIQQSWKKFQSLVETTSDFIWEMDLHGFYTYCSPQIEKLWGLKPEEMLGKTPFDLLPPEDREQSLKAFSALSESLSPFTNMEMRSFDSTGQIKFLEISGVPFFDDAGKLCGYRGISRDVTERKQAKEQYQTIVQSMVDGFWITDPQGHFLDVNNAYCRLIGYSREELLKMSITDIEAKETKEETEQHTQRIIKLGGDRFETRHRCKNGKIINVEVTNTYSDVADGRLYVFLRDITERKKAEAKLLKSRQQLRNLSARLQLLREEERTNLAREIHDELGQAMTALKMDLSWLSGRLPQENEALQNKAKTMSQVIDTTMQTVRRMSTELRPGLLDDLGLVAAMEWQAEEFKKRTGINCSLVFSPKEIDMERDMATAFFRIFQELVTNISRHARATAVTASLKKEADIIELSVRDNGKGITRDEVASSKSLGLTGIRERTYHFRGTVEIKGTPGKGTTVIVRIPVKEPTR